MASKKKESRNRAQSDGNAKQALSNAPLSQEVRAHHGSRLHRPQHTPSKQAHVGK